MPATTVFALGLMLGAAGVAAQDLDADRFTLRGFGTLGATTHDADDVEFRRTTGQAHGAESGDVDFAVDSIAGIQLDVELSSKFDLLVQGVSRMGADGSWAPRLAQGFLRYSPDDSLVLRAGRVGYDIYLLAESRQVGYSYLTVRPSTEFYGQIPNDELDGLDASYTWRAAGGLFRARLFGGDGYGEYARQGESYGTNRNGIVGGTFDFIYRGWTARVAFVDISYEAPPEVSMLAGVLRATGVPAALAVADDIEQGAYVSRGVQVGVAYDEGPVLAQFMYGAANSDSLTGPNFDKVYALFGYRTGKWTPFVAHARSSDRDPVRDAGLPALPMLQPLNEAVMALQEATRSTQHTSSIGVRYDLSSRVAFKAQLDHTRVRGSSLPFDYRPQPGSPFDMTVLTAAVDFMF
jgi:hypothetical protein